MLVESECVSVCSRNCHCLKDQHHPLFTSTRSRSISICDIAWQSGCLSRAWSLGVCVNKRSLKCTFPKREIKKLTIVHRREYVNLECAFFLNTLRKWAGRFHRYCFPVQVISKGDRKTLRTKGLFQLSICFKKKNRKIHVELPNRFAHLQLYLCTVVLN
jgi:hypothetical protein